VQAVESEVVNVHQRRGAMTATTDDRHGEGQYEPPEVKDYGRLSDLTAGSSSGTKLDAAFPAGTLFNDLTFS
jgi:hypothetical protein